MPDDARAATREQVDWSFDFIAENPGDALDEIDRLSNLNAELLAVVKRTLSLFEALNLDMDECARIRDLVGRAEK